MAKYHVNPKGETGECGAENGGCPFDEGLGHFDTENEARIAFEQSQDTFSVVIKKNESLERNIEAHDSNLAQNIAVAQVEFEAAEDRAKWIDSKVLDLDAAQADLDKTLPGSPERLATLASRTGAREQLLAADLVVWRSSPFYDESVENRMKETSIIVSDADSSIETALADARGKELIAREFGISERDVENILEVTHRDYLRPRAPLSSSIADLSDNNNYAATTAHVFRMEPEAVKGVLNYASNYSSVKKNQIISDIYVTLDEF